jgi:HD-like signal output (HDOD) protein
MWKNAALTARVARRLAEWQRVGRPEDAYVAALLHNLGEFVLVWKIAEENPPDLGERLAMESDRIATQHESVGALAAQKWGLPPQVQAVAGFHHKGRAHEPPQDVALRTTILACWALSRSVAGDYLPNMAPADPIEFFEQLGLAEQLRVRVAEECLAALEGL